MYFYPACQPFEQQRGAKGATSTLHPTTNVASQPLSTLTAHVTSHFHATQATCVTVTFSRNLTQTTSVSSLFGSTQTTDVTRSFTTTLNSTKRTNMSSLFDQTQTTGVTSLLPPMESTDCTPHRQQV